MRHRRILVVAAIAAATTSCRDRASNHDEAIGTTEIRGAPTVASAPAAATNAPPFEGELALEVPGRRAASLVYAMKGDKIRLGMSGAGKGNEGVDAIIDTAAKKATILLNDRRAFFELDLAKLTRKARSRVEEMDVERTGRSDTVAGRTCEEWQMRDRDLHVTACVAECAPYFDLDTLEKQAGFTAPAWAHRIVDAGYAPLRVSVTDASGKPLVTSQVGETSGRRVDATTFEVPAGYERTDIAKLKRKR